MQNKVSQTDNFMKSSVETKLFILYHAFRVGRPCILEARDRVGHKKRILFDGFPNFGFLQLQRSFPLRLPKGLEN